MFTIFFSNKIAENIRKFSVDFLYKEFGLKADVVEFNIDDLAFAYNKYRKQYDAALILERFARIARNFLVILDGDIYVEGLNFVFGVSYVGIGAVISTYRFWIGADEKRFFSRLGKTIKHELGHYFGLKHCENACVMRFANSIFELDLKPFDFCDRCKSFLNKKGVMQRS